MKPLAWPCNFHRDDDVEKHVVRYVKFYVTVCKTEPLILVLEQLLRGVITVFMCAGGNSQALLLSLFMMNGIQIGNKSSCK